MKEDRLFEQFPPVETGEWMDRILADLKGADFSKKMVWKTDEGFDVKPFYRVEDLKYSVSENYGYSNFDFPVRKGKIGNSWLVRQDTIVNDYTAANRKALDLLLRGVSSLGFVIENPETVNAVNFRLLLSDLHPGSCELNIRCREMAKEILAILSGFISDSGTDPVSVHGAIEADPLSLLMLNGTLCETEEACFDYLASLTESSSGFPFLRTIHLEASNFCNAGADLVRELAFAISMGCEYLSQLTMRGLEPEFAASKIRFSFGIGSAYFPEIAKLRAARWLWAAVLNRFMPESGSAPVMDIHSITSRWNKTIFDPYVNMLRTQTEAMSAILGGADSLTVEPFDIVFRSPGEFSERIARNQQLLLKEESYFDKVADPSAGCFYIENLTRQLAVNAWKLFVDIENQGGFLNALREGTIQKLLAESASRRRKDAATRRKVFIGTNKYPDPEGMIPSEAALKNMSGKPDGMKEKSVEPVALFRGSEEFERLRLEVTLSVKPPAVFLFPIGDQVMRKARAQFTAGFFGCVGYRIIDNDGFGTADEGIKAFLSSGADIAAICSSDEGYSIFAPEIYARLKDMAIVVVAGDPALLGGLQTAGPDIFIHQKSDVPEMIRYFNRRLGIEPGIGQSVR